MYSNMDQNYTTRSQYYSVTATSLIRLQFSCELNGSCSNAATREVLIVPFNRLYAIDALLRRARAMRLSAVDAFLRQLRSRLLT